MTHHHDDQTKVTVVVPVYCEYGHLRPFVEKVTSELRATGLRWELLIVDDGSEDNTWQAIQDEAGRCHGVRGIRLSRNFGKESAIRAGLEHADGDAVLIMDGDGQHPPELIGKLVDTWRRTGADVVEGRKTSRGRERWYMRLLASTFYRLFNILAGWKLAAASDYKLLGPRAVRALREMPESAAFFRGMVEWIGYRKVEVPFEVGGRMGGKTRWSAYRLFVLAINVITSFSTVPLYFIGWLGVVTLLGGIVLGTIVLIQKLAGVAVTGFATVIILQLIIGSLIMIALAIIGVYIARIYEEVKSRPKYLIEGIVDHSHNEP